MGLHKLFLACLAIGGALVLASSAAAETYPYGCNPPDGPPCLPNTVPCAHCIGTWEDDFGYGYLVIGSSNPMGRLSRGTFTLVARLGGTYMNDVVNFYGGTFNVLSRQKDAGGLKLVVEMYGTQDLHISRAKAPRSIVSSDPTALKINTTRFDAGSRELVVNLTATDIQGVTGIINIE